MNLEHFLSQNSKLLGNETPWEHLFVENVLSRVDSLDFARVGIQTPFRDSQGRDQRIDFTIQEGAMVRIAPEVDGYDKRGRGTGWTSREFKDYLRREADISGAGWVVLRFANALVRDEPENCARNIALVLRRERAKAADQGGVLPKGGSEALSPEEAEELMVLDALRQETLEDMAGRLRFLSSSMNFVRGRFS